MFGFRGCNWQCFRKACGLVNNEVVQYGILLLIVVHATSLGLQASSDVVSDSLDRFDLICLVVFSTEIALQVIHRGVAGFMKQPWLCFDSLVVVVSWVLEIAVLRSVRVLTVIRLTSRLPSLQEILKALAFVWPSLGAILALLLLVLYLYAVLCTNLFADLSPVTDEDYFGGMDRTLFTLFQLMTLADWNIVVEQIAEHYAWSRYIFISFIVITSFILYSLVTAVICQAVSEPHHEKSIRPRIGALVEKLVAIQERQEQILKLCDELVEPETSRPDEESVVVCIEHQHRRLFRNPNNIPESSSRSDEEDFVVCIESQDTRYQQREPLPESRPSSYLSVERGETRWRWLRTHCGIIINSHHTQRGITGLILLNSFTMGLETFDFISKHTQVMLALDVLDRSILVLFTIELVLHLVYKCSLKDAWLTFDLVVIVASWSFEQLQVARAFRIIRVARLGAKMKNLKELLQALVDVSSSVLVIIACLVIIIYIYCVLCTALLSDAFRMGLTDVDYFGTLGTSAFTLFQMTTLEGWAAIVRQIQPEYPWAWLVFVSYVTLTSFILFSIMIAVICDAVANEDDDIGERETKIMVQNLNMQLDALLRREVDINRAARVCKRSIGVVSEGEFEDSSTQGPNSENSTVVLAGNSVDQEKQEEEQSLSSSGSETSSIEVDIITPQRLTI